MADIEALHRLLIRVTECMAPWATAEAAVGGFLPGRSIYLGGDGLRPYVSWMDHQAVHVVGVQPTSLPRAPLVHSLVEGAFGPVAVVYDEKDRRLFHIEAPRSDSLDELLDVPRVMIVGLGDAERYRGARLALGIARLSQWLRFTHAAQVAVIDYNVMATPLQYVSTQLASQSFDIVGVSVNFGQWHMLQDLAQVINQHRPGLVALGNILAAFMPDKAAGLFDANRDGSVLVATSLGERPLEALCREFRNPSAFDSISGLVRPGSPSRLTVSNPSRIEPPELVHPDDALTAAVVERGGQLALESSFGCQYGACTFCPRDHRGSGWERGRRSTMVAMLERVASTGAALSLVDEEFFGAEGLVDPPLDDLVAADVMATCRRLGISYEIYTRLQQLFDRRRSRAWNLTRARLLADEAPGMRRIFVGVESGSPTQLRRYGKGQTVGQTVDALRVGSIVGVPMEFGFITFDPLLTPAELADNIDLLARQDVLIEPSTLGSADERVQMVAAYLDGHDPPFAGVPVYRQVAYMATELEVLAHSRYAERLRRQHPELLDGTFDPTFARHGVQYQDCRIADVASWCRVWTEGMFVPIYEARMEARASPDPSIAAEAKSLVLRYREATFTLLLCCTIRFIPGLAPRLTATLANQQPLRGNDPELWLYELAAATLPTGPTVDFDVRLRNQRRER